MVYLEATAAECQTLAIVSHGYTSDSYIEASDHTELTDIHGQVTLSAAGAGKLRIDNSQSSLPLTGWLLTSNQFRQLAAGDAPASITYTGFTGLSVLLGPASDELRVGWLAAYARRSRSIWLEVTTGSFWASRTASHDCPPSIRPW